MKTEWICLVTLTPGRKKYAAAFPSQAEAHAAMAKVFADTIDLSKYIQALRKEDGEDCGSSADFLGKFLSTLTMPDDLPDCYDIPDHCLFEFDSCDGFRWGYMRGECPYLSAGHVYEGKEIEPFVVAFNYDNPKTVSPNRVNAIEIRITKHIHYGSSAYPLMVWHAIGNRPQTQGQIVQNIYETWGTVINRKAVGRHLQLLQDMGYPVRHCPDGYCYSTEPQEPKADIKLSSSAYALLVLKTLDHRPPKTIRQIIQAIQEKFGIKIDRKAVGRHLELLGAMGIHIEKCEDGYYIGK